MKMPKFLFVTLLILIGYIPTANAQFGVSHEIGVIVGPVAFQSDYGERHDFATNAGNTGYGIGLIHYLNFSYKAECNCYTPETYFNDHFKLRSELSYNKTKLDHFGEWVAPERTSFGARKLRAMHGSTAVTNLGMQLEFFPYSIRDFTSTIGAWAPFISLGAQFSFYKPDAYSDLDTGSTTGLGLLPSVTIDEFIGGVETKGGSTMSVVSSVGSRYKLTELSDLMIDLRMQYYFSNWVDGLNPNPLLQPSNKANDWNVWLNFGYIYYLQ
jgi:hypothetical protein